MVIAGIAAVLFAMVAWQSSHPRAVCDVGGSPLRGICVQFGQILALVTAVVFLVRYGQAGFEALLPVWAGMLGAGLYRLVNRIFRFDPKGGG